MANSKNCWLINNNTKYVAHCALIQASIDKSSRGTENHLPALASQCSPIQYHKKYYIIESINIIRALILAAIFLSWWLGLECWWYVLLQHHYPLLPTWVTTLDYFRDNYNHVYLYSCTAVLTPAAFNQTWWGKMWNNSYTYNDC